MDYLPNNPFLKWFIQQIIHFENGLYNKQSILEMDYLTNNRRAELDSLLNNPLIWII